MKFRLILLTLVLSGILPAQVSGIVLEQGSKTPVPGAIVTVQGTSTRVTCAPDGTFLIPGLNGSNIVIVAAKKGYYNDGRSVSAPSNGHVLIIEQVPVANDPNYQFQDPNTCATCHPDQWSQWTGSAMAHAGVNTWVYDIYDGTGSAGGLGGFVYTRDSVHATSNPNSECAACHQPEPWIKVPGSAMEPLNNLSVNAMHGVACDTCHKIAHVDETKTNYPGIHSAAVVFNRPNLPHQVQYGRLGDTTFSMPGLMQPSYQPQLDAAVCATCHQDKNDPDGNGNFEEPNGVISEPTFLEWRQSPYGDPNSPMYTSCVDCHMPAYGATMVSPLGVPGRDPNSIRSHRIEGTTPFYLENAVDMTMNAQQIGDNVDVVVSVANTKTGHHVPTGVTVRNVILVVEAWRVVDGVKLAHTGTQVVDALGGVGDPNQGYYAGLAGKLFAKKNHDANGNGPTFFTDATGISWDTRIPPLATDTTSYSFQVPPGSGIVMVRARLIYRRAFRAFVDAKQWTTDGHGNPLQDIVAPHYGHLMEDATWSSGGPGPVRSFGSGCGNLYAGWLGVPTLGATNFGVTLSGSGGSVVTSLLSGPSNQSWLGNALPLNFAPLGAPDCDLLVAPMAMADTLSDPTGWSHLPLFIPPVPQLVGAKGYLQWIASDPNSPIGWSFSNGLEIIIQP